MGPTTEKKAAKSKSKETDRKRNRESDASTAKAPAKKSKTSTDDTNSQKKTFKSSEFVSEEDLLSDVQDEPITTIPSSLPFHPAPHNTPVSGKAERDVSKKKKESKRKSKLDASGNVTIPESPAVNRSSARPESPPLKRKIRPDAATEGSSEDKIMEEASRDSPNGAPEKVPSPEVRRHKRQKSESKSEKKTTKEKKRKEHRTVTQLSVEAEHVTDAPVMTEAEPVQRKEKKKKKKAREPSPPRREATVSDAETSSPDAAAAATAAYQQAVMPDASEPPFFTQTVALFLPLYPVGFDDPADAVCKHHLDPMVGRYVPKFRGVLLAYRNVAIGDEPGRKAAARDDNEKAYTIIDEFAGVFVWATVEVDLFVPRRGAWMEGVMTVQNEGHIGFVCWKRFNASIEASRLPDGYRWIEFGSREAAAYEADEAQDEDGYDAEGNALEPVHSTGFWVDDEGKKLGGKLRFRIKNFDVGVNGEDTFLSIEGTMLTDEGEQALAAIAAENARQRRSKGILRNVSRQVHQFGVTKFGHVERDEDEVERNGLDAVARSSRASSAVPTEMSRASSVAPGEKGSRASSIAPASSPGVA